MTYLFHTVFPLSKQTILLCQQSKPNYLQSEKDGVKC